MIQPSTYKGSEMMVPIYTEASVGTKSASKSAMPPQKSLRIATGSFRKLAQVCWTSKGKEESVKLWFVRLRRHECNLAERANPFRVMQRLFHYPRKHTFNQQDVHVWLHLVHGYRNIWTSIDKCPGGSPHCISTDQPPHSLSMPVDDCTSPHYSAF